MIKISVCNIKNRINEITHTQKRIPISDNADKKCIDNNITNGDKGKNKLNEK